MKNKELFEKTVGILVEAYRNDTLAHGYCSACAVGNLVAAARGHVIEKGMGGHPQWKDATPTWGWVFHVDGYDHINNKPIQRKRPYNYRGNAKIEIDSTGYSWEELAKIEYAFESVYAPGNAGHDPMLDGLLAVYDVLCEIHEVDNGEVRNGREVFSC